MEQRSLDFLFWHASSKLNNAQFGDAAPLFQLISERRPDDLSAAIAFVYCKLRLGDASDLEDRLSAMRDLCKSDYERSVVNRLRLRADWLRSGQ